MGHRVGGVEIRPSQPLTKWAVGWGVREVVKAPSHGAFGEGCMTMGKPQVGGGSRVGYTCMVQRFGPNGGNTKVIQKMTKCWKSSGELIWWVVLGVGTLTMADVGKLEKCQRLVHLAIG